MTLKILELMIEWLPSRTVTDIAVIAHGYAILASPTQAFCACRQAAHADSCVQHVHWLPIHRRYKKGLTNFINHNPESLKRQSVRLPEMKDFFGVAQDHH